MNGLATRPAQSKVRRPEFGASTLLEQLHLAGRAPKVGSPFCEGPALPRCTTGCEGKRAWAWHWTFMHVIGFFICDQLTLISQNSYVTQMSNVLHFSPFFNVLFIFERSRWQENKLKLDIWSKEAISNCLGSLQLQPHRSLLLLHPRDCRAVIGVVSWGTSRSSKADSFQEEGWKDFLANLHLNLKTVFSLSFLVYQSFSVWG